MRARRVPVPLVLAATLLLGGCVSWGGPRRAHHDITVLADRVRALEEKVATHEAELARLRAEPAVPRAAAPPSGVEAPPLVEIPAATATPPLPAVEASELPLASAPPPPAVFFGRDVQSSYEAALALYDAGDLAAAEAAFRSLVAHYPESELADNALFWIGAAQMKRGDDAAAEATMRALIEGYPAGNKVPDALFQLGVLRARAGDPEGARAAFETVLDHFPLTEAADRAAERLRSSSPSP